MILENILYQLFAFLTYISVWQVCSQWIGSGISRDINDVRRIQQMLATSLGKITSQETGGQQIYSESAYTLESLAVLKAWAKVRLKFCPLFFY